MLLTSLLTKENVIAIIVILAIMVILALAFNLIVKKQAKEDVTVNSRKRLIKDLIFKAIPFMDMPQGGSVSLTMLPLLVISFRNGPKWGLIGGLLYAVINLLLDGKLYHWSSIFLDYLFAFGIMGIAGLFRTSVIKSNNVLSYVFLVIGSSIAVFGRLVFAVLSGIIAFETPFGASVAYNAPYVLISGALCIIALCIIKNIVLYEIK